MPKFTEKRKKDKQRDEQGRYVGSARVDVEPNINTEVLRNLPRDEQIDILLFSPA